MVRKGLGGVFATPKVGKDSQREDKIRKDSQLACKIIIQKGGEKCLGSNLGSSEKSQVYVQKGRWYTVLL